MVTLGIGVEDIVFHSANTNLPFLAICDVHLWLYSNVKLEKMYMSRLYYA